MYDQNLDKMKIDVISMYFPPEKGAAASRVSRMCEELSAAGHDVQVITSLPNYPAGAIFRAFRGMLFHRGTYSGIKVLSIWAYASNSSNLLPRLLGMISFACGLILVSPRSLLRRPHAVFVNSPPLISAAVTVALGRLFFRKVILNVSDLWPRSALDIGVLQQGFYFKLLECLEAFAYKSAHLIVTQSEEARRHVLQSNPTKKVVLYRNIYPPSSGEKASREKGTEPPRIIYAGLLGHAQGVYDICKNIDFKSLGCELHIYGDGGEREKIASLVNAYDTGISLHSMVEPYELDTILGGFSASLIPLKKSIYGALPSKIFHAISHGMPVIFSGDGEGYRIVEEKGIGFASGHGDYQSLAKNIQSFVNLSKSDYSALCDTVLSARKHEYGYESNLIELLSAIEGVKS